jgi:leucyl/phenylalanyl-tRNA---protein transferase
MRPILLPADSEAPFPSPELALRRPNGLLAMGGDLSPTRLLNAYRQGIFPWFSAGEPILWWSPDPRLVFRTDAVHLSRRLRRSLRGSGWVLRADTAFASVMDACASAPRPGQSGTWITPAMRAAYVALHRLGHAHSVEVWDGESLVGGIYGVAVGRMFFGESMVSLASGGSSAALAGLCVQLADWGHPLMDAQMPTPHLQRLGGLAMARRDFLPTVAALVEQPGRIGPWSRDFGSPSIEDVLAASGR